MHRNTVRTCTLSIFLFSQKWMTHFLKISSPPAILQTVKERNWQDEHKNVKIIPFLLKSVRAYPEFVFVCRLFIGSCHNLACVTFESRGVNNTWQVNVAPTSNLEREVACWNLSSVNNDMTPINKKRDNWKKKKRTDAVAKLFRTEMTRIVWFIS